MENYGDEEMEKDEVESYFEDHDLDNIEPLYLVLSNYLQSTPISSMMNKDKNEETLVFKQTINGVLYRGFIKVNYLDCSRFKKLNRCLYITHVIITPRKGKILDTELKRLLNDMTNIDSIFIESILSDKVIDSFSSNGWTIDGDNAFIKKTSTGGKKRKSHKKRRINKRKTIKRK
jgi:hypothetical protein